MQPKAQTAHFDLDKVILTWKTVLYNLFLITAGNRMDFQQYQPGGRDSLNRIISA